MTIKPNELIGDKYQNIHTSGLWKEQWNQMIIEMGTIIINKGREIKDAISSYSGGGCYHFIIKTDEFVTTTVMLPAHHYLENEELERIANVLS